jgi:hypothetical protein
LGDLELGMKNRELGMRRSDKGMKFVMLREDEWGCSFFGKKISHNQIQSGL